MAGYVWQVTAASDGRGSARAVVPADSLSSHSRAHCTHPHHTTQQTSITRSGSPLDAECPADAHKLSGGAGATYLVVDTNVALHQMDFLEHPAVTDVIVCKTVMEEVSWRGGR